MSEFTDKIVADILKAEGGYQNDAADKRGNTNSQGISVGTNLGISAPVWEEKLGRPPTVADMKAITKEQAKQFYEDKYINNIEEDYGIGPDHPAFEQVVDMGVNHSPKAVAAILQRAVGAKVDGEIGPKTKAKIKSAGAINNKLVDERKKYYEQIMKSNPDFEKYRNGWMKRADKFMALEPVEVTAKRK